MLNALAIIFHLIAINIWVGGMFIIIIVLAKVVSTLEKSAQQVFWQGTLRRFFFWVWLAVIGLLGTGFGMIFYRFGGIEYTPWYVLVMAGLGISMAIVFMVIYFIFYKNFEREFNMGNIEGSRRQLRIIRGLGIVNMVLGFCVMVVIGGSPYLAG
jgi:uncharacterized membrane protein